MLSQARGRQRSLVWMAPSSTRSERESNAPVDVRRDPLWRVQAYRLARSLLEPCWQDVLAIGRTPYGPPVARQLWRAATAIAPDISEGYSRSSPADRIRYLEYALGSARESLDHYRTAALMLPTRDMSPVTTALSSTRNLLLTMIAGQRARLPRKPDFGG
jgi:four helix bundle protein